MYLNLSHNSVREFNSASIANFAPLRKDEFQRLFLQCEHTFLNCLCDLCVQIIFHIFSFFELTQVHLPVQKLHEQAEDSTMTTPSEDFVQ